MHQILRLTVGLASWLTPTDDHPGALLADPERKRKEGTDICNRFYVIDGVLITENCISRNEDHEESADKGYQSCCQSVFLVTGERVRWGIGGSTSRLV